MQGQSPDMTNALPQSQPLNERQVPNNAGGFTFQASSGCPSSMQGISTCSYILISTYVTQSHTNAAVSA